jgi:hypothetical protein
MGQVNVYGQLLGSLTLDSGETASQVAWAFSFGQAIWIQAQPLSGLDAEKVFEVRNFAEEVGADGVWRVFYDVVNTGPNWGSCAVRAFWTDPTD